MISQNGVIFSNVKYTKNVKFLSGIRGPQGPDLSSPCGRKFQFLVFSIFVIEERDGTCEPKVKRPNVQHFRQS